MLGRSIVIEAVSEDAYASCEFFTSSQSDSTNRGPDTILSRPIGLEAGHVPLEVYELLAKMLRQISGEDGDEISPSVPQSFTNLAPVSRQRVYGLLELLERVHRVAPPAAGSVEDYANRAAALLRACSRHFGEAYRGCLTDRA